VKDKRLDAAHALLQDWADWTLRHVLEHPDGRSIEAELVEYGQAVGTGVFSSRVPDYIQIPHRLCAIDRCMRKGVVPTRIRVMVFYRYTTLWRDPRDRSPVTDTDRFNAWHGYTGKGKRRYYEIAEQVLWYVAGATA
jgi:hypothetical protein